MVTAELLLEKIRSYNASVNEARFLHACEFSMKAHGSQKRASGDLYYHHPLEVTEILADMKMDEDTLITALLHDTVEDTEVTLEEVRDIFGEGVATLVDGVTKLAKIEFQTEHARQAENFRKLLVAMSEDIRVLLVKLADRLHNMQTLHFVKSPQKRARIAHETMEIYAPLAERIGMQQMKNELQELAFTELHHEAHDSIVSRLEYLRKDGSGIVEDIVAELQKKFRKGKVKAEVYGREKSPCSIWRKMERKNISFEQLSDIVAFRVIVDSTAECYKALGVIHAEYACVPGTFKDYISTPKDNGYQSIHTVVMGPHRRFVEVQIRSRSMHEIAELGVAAHWSYKQGEPVTKDGKQYRWVRELLYILEHANDPEEFLEHTKLEMYYDRVFSFTPKGTVIVLPRGSTPVDFAYAVHSDIGFHCAGAKVNGRIVPLRTQLNNGDQVEIITSKNQVPSPSWEQFVVTGKARSEIRRFVRARKREEYLKLGHSILGKALEENKLPVEDASLEPALKILGRKAAEDIYLAVGEGVLTADEVMQALLPGKAKTSKDRKSPFSILRFKRLKEEKKREAIPIKGLIPGMAVYFAECCHPIPGDKIVGVVTTGKGMTIHTSDCDMLENFASTPERLVDVAWDKESNEKSHLARLKITLAHEAGSLAALCEIIAREHGNINNLKITDRTPEYFEMMVDVDVRGANHLNNIISSLRTREGIHSVERFRQ